MRRAAAALVLGVALVPLAGCGSDDPPPPRAHARASFEANPYAPRVFERYRQVGDASAEVTLPRGSKAVQITLDCAGTSGTISVATTGAGSATADCRSEARGLPSSVVLEDETKVPARKQKVTITVSGSHEWSVAIDAGAKVTAN